ncbi:MAG: DUF2605 domain-containing protein [Leptolyngbyaceae bacterium]|nr:DUF2605 domain-containing protein [Leptolyngbyaceae bacterium]
MNNQADQTKLLQTVLKPLLEDFLYWFGQAKTLLENHDIPTLDTAEQADLLARITEAHQEVTAAQTLFTALGAQVAVDMAVVNQWHQLVAECWAVSLAYRRAQDSTP